LRFGSDTKAAKRLLIRLMKKQGLPLKRIVTDKLRSYAAAKRDVMSAVEHRSHKGLQSRGKFPSAAPKTRAGDAGFPICRRLATFHLGLFRSQNFVAPHRKRSALDTHIHRIRAMAQWKAVTAAAV